MLPLASPSPSLSIHFFSRRRRRPVAGLLEDAEAGVTVGDGGDVADGGAAHAFRAVDVAEPVQVAQLGGQGQAGIARVGVGPGRDGAAGQAGDGLAARLAARLVGLGQGDALDLVGVQAQAVLGTRKGGGEEGRVREREGTAGAPEEREKKKKKPSDPSSPPAFLSLSLPTHQE